jgi:hypothetical protein
VHLKVKATVALIEIIINPFPVLEKQDWLACIRGVVQFLLCFVGATWRGAEDCRVVWNPLKRLHRMGKLSQMRWDLAASGFQSPNDCVLALLGSEHVWWSLGAWRLTMGG